MINHAAGWIRLPVLPAGPGTSIPTLSSQDELVYRDDQVIALVIAADGGPTTRAMCWSCPLRITRTSTTCRRSSARHSRRVIRDVALAMKDAYGCDW